MRIGAWCAEAVRRGTQRIFSVPLFVKIMGIGLLVAAVFGVVTLVFIRGSISLALRQVQEQRAWSMARSVAASIERPISTGDTLSVHEKLRQTQRLFPEIRYLVVRSPQGRILAHTFRQGLPPDLAALLQDEAVAGESFFVLSSEEEAVFHVRCAILEGHGGGLDLGMSDRMITQELSAITRSVLWSLLLCAALGALLALILTHLLTHPIHNLVTAARAVSRGDFAVKANVYYGDEIGRLAEAFNQMTDALERYRQDVARREQTRQSLIQRIVNTQEEERRTISRELHDELGQSLLALLLAVETDSADSPMAPDQRRDFARRIRAIIEEVRRLAWGMHPSILDDYGLDSALSRLVQEVSGRGRLAVDYQSLGPSDLPRLGREVEVTLYRVAQEALTNAVRHARAAQCSVVLLRGREEVTLLVEDDGCGFDASAEARREAGGLGLTGIRERVALLGGRCEIESSSGAGTRVRVQVPLKEVEPCRSAC